MENVRPFTPRAAEGTAGAEFVAQMDRTTGFTEASAQLSGSGRARPSRPARLPWGSAAAIAAFLLMIGLAVGFAWTEGDPDLGAASLAAEWLAAFQAFLFQVYGDLDIHILLAMSVLGLALERLIPARRQAMSNSLLNIPYSACVLLFVGAIFPLQLLLAETLVEWTGFAHIFDLSFETRVSIPLVAAALLVQ